MHLTDEWDAVMQERKTKQSANSTDRAQNSI